MTAVCTRGQIPIFLKSKISKMVAVMRTTVFGGGASGRSPPTVDDLKHCDKLPTNADINGMFHCPEGRRCPLDSWGEAPSRGHWSKDRRSLSDCCRGGEPILSENCIFRKLRSPIGLLPAPAVRRTATISAKSYFAEIYFHQGKGG